MKMICRNCKHCDLFTYVINGTVIENGTCFMRVMISLDGACGQWEEKDEPRTAPVSASEVEWLKIDLNRLSSEELNKKYGI